MGKEFTNLTEEDLCDLMCGTPEEDADDFVLTEENYYSQEANERYMSFHTYLSYVGGMKVAGCEAKAEAIRKGEWKEDEKSVPFMVGSYVDEALTGTKESFELFKKNNPDIFTQKGELKAQFKQAEKMIARCKADEFFMKTLSGEHQKIMTAYWEGCEWKIKMDSYIPGVLITDLKTSAEIHRMWNISDYGYVSFVEAFNYVGQLALYQKVVELNTGEKLPVCISVVTKEDYPEIKCIGIDQVSLDHALESIKMNLPFVLGIRKGEYEPVRCGKCNYCRSTEKIEGLIPMQDLIEV